MLEAKPGHRETRDSTQGCDRDTVLKSKLGKWGHGARDGAGVMRGQCSGQSRAGGCQPSAACPGWGHTSQRQGVAPAALQMARGWQGAGRHCSAAAVSLPGRGGNALFPLPGGRPGPQPLTPVGGLGALWHGGSHTPEEEAPSEPPAAAFRFHAGSPTQGPGRGGGGAEEEPWAAAALALHPRSHLAPVTSSRRQQPRLRPARPGRDGAVAPGRVVCGQGVLPAGLGDCPLSPAVLQAQGFTTWFTSASAHRRSPAAPSPVRGSQGQTDGLAPSLTADGDCHHCPLRSCLALRGALVFLGQISWAGRAAVWPGQWVHPQNLHPFARGVSSLVLDAEPGSPHPMPGLEQW